MLCKWQWAWGLMYASLIEILNVWAGFTAPAAVELFGTTRSMLFSRSGVVIMKIINNTKTRSSIGVMFSSVRVCRPFFEE